MQRPVSPFLFPIAFLVGLALWSGFCAFAATVLRNFASYSAALAGYAAAIFTWVRLAQRMPVRVRIDQTPAGLRLVAGMTATGELEPRRPGPAYAGENAPE
jgi:hypothetical protein